MRRKTDLGSVAHLNAVRYHCRNNAIPVRAGFRRNHHKIRIINEISERKGKAEKENLASCRLLRKKMGGLYAQLRDM